MPAKLLALPLATRTSAALKPVTLSLKVAVTPWVALLVVPVPPPLRTTEGAVSSAAWKYETVTFERTGVASTFVVASSARYWMYRELPVSAPPEEATGWNAVHEPSGVVVSPVR